MDSAPHWQALETDPNPFATVVLAHLKTLETRQAPADRLVWKVRLVKGLYERGLSAEDVRQLFRFIDWIMDLPPAREQLFREEIYRYEEEQCMPYMTSLERMARAEELLAGIELGLDLKFGADGLQLLPEIREIHDHEVLRTVLQAIKTVDNPEKLRRFWAQKRRPKKGRQT